MFLEKSLQMPSWMRPAVALVTLFVAVVLADRIGIINLVAKGYGSLTWAFLLIIFVPLVTVGVWRISQAHRAET